MKDAEGDAEAALGRGWPRLRLRDFWLLCSDLQRGLGQWSLLALTPAAFGKVWRHFELSQPEGKCCCHLVGGGRAAANCPAVHRTAAQPPRQSSPAPNVSSAEVEKL